MRSYGPCDNLDLRTFVEEPTGPNYTYPYAGHSMMTDALRAWRIANWGVKWNTYAGELELTDDGAVLKFESADAWPQPVYKRIPNLIINDPLLADLEIDYTAFCEGWSFAVEGGVAKEGWTERVVCPDHQPEDARRIFIECYGCTPEEDEAAARADWTESEWADEAAAMAADAA